MTKAWDEMTERHKQERIDLVKVWALTKTQSETADILGVSRQNLNMFGARSGITWAIRGKKKKNESTSK
jgi:hypothetical protein|tara:strand:+ start:328 stop:534 length:207 start_codon:yes stop_codon:yes gene_type:complete